MKELLRAEDAAQKQSIACPAQGPEFEPQCHFKKKKKKIT
jgi:hypothetical protein